MKRQLIPIINNKQYAWYRKQKKLSITRLFGCKIDFNILNEDDFFLFLYG